MPLRIQIFRNAYKFCAALPPKLQKKHTKKKNKKAAKNFGQSIVRPNLWYVLAKFMWQSKLENKQQMSAKCLMNYVQVGPKLSSALWPNQTEQLAQCQRLNESSSCCFAFHLNLTSIKLMSSSRKLWHQSRRKIDILLNKSIFLNSAVFHL